MLLKKKKKKKKKSKKRLQLRGTQVNNLFTHFFQDWNVHQQTANLQIQWTLCAQVLHFQQFQGSFLWIPGVLHCKVDDFEELPDEFKEAPLSQPFFTRR